MNMILSNLIWHTLPIVSPPPIVLGVVEALDAFKFMTPDRKYVARVVINTVEVWTR